MSSEVLTWLLTSTTYGTWLPGDPRGFVGRVWDKRPDDATTETHRVEHNQVHTPYDRDMPGLYAASQERLKGRPILLTSEQAQAVLKQFQETAGYRRWELHATSVMANHFHLVVTAPETTLTKDLLRDFKSYSARVLNCLWGRPESGTWWTASGSRRRLPTERAVADAIAYVLDQPRFLARWLNPQCGQVSDWLRSAEGESPSGGRQPAV
ncbi:MAG: transposase [Gemmatales bacterium]|nr:transposase [Gemmatales bacterium]MDW8386672.1 transposase [Gemmatales bacterium]